MQRTVLIVTAGEMDSTFQGVYVCTELADAIALLAPDPNLAAVSGDTASGAQSDEAAVAFADAARWDDDWEARTAQAKSVTFTRIDRSQLDR